MKKGICLTSGVIAACAGLLLTAMPISAQAATTTRTASNGQVIYQLETTTNSEGKEVRVSEQHYTAEGRLTWNTLYDEKGQVIYSEHSYEDGTRYILVRDPKTNVLTQVYDLDEDRGEESIYALDRFWLKVDAIKRYTEQPVASGSGSSGGSGSSSSSSGSSDGSSSDSGQSRSSSNSGRPIMGQPSSRRD